MDLGRSVPHGAVMYQVWHKLCWRFIHRKAVIMISVVRPHHARCRRNILPLAGSTFLFAAFCLHPAGLATARAYPAPRHCALSLDKLRGTRATAAGTTICIIDLMNRHRWADLYRMTAPLLRNHVSEEAFARTFANSFVSARTVGRGVLRTPQTDNGVSALFQARASYQQGTWVRLRTAGGAVRAHNGYIILVLVGSAWYLGPTDDWSR